jgi:hypothetical protein
MICVLAYLDQLEGLPEDVKKTSLEAVGAFAAFAYGEKPWEAFGEAGGLCGGTLGCFGNA